MHIPHFILRLSIELPTSCTYAIIKKTCPHIILHIFFQRVFNIISVVHTLHQYVRVYLIIIVYNLDFIFFENIFNSRNFHNENKALSSFANHTPISHNQLHWYCRIVHLSIRILQLCQKLLVICRLGGYIYIVTPSLFGFFNVNL